MNSAFKNSVKQSKEILDNADEHAGGSAGGEKIDFAGIYRVKPSTVAFKKKDGSEFVSPRFEKDDKGRWKYSMSFVLTQDVGAVPAGSYFYHSFTFAQDESADPDKKQNTANLAKKYIRELVGQGVEIEMSNPEWLEKTLATVSEEGSDGKLKVVRAADISNNEYRVRYEDDGKGYGMKCTVELWDESKHAGTLKLIDPPADLTDDSGLGVGITADTSATGTTDTTEPVTSKTLNPDNYDDDLPF